MNREQQRVRAKFQKLRKANRFHFPPAHERLHAPPKHGAYIVYDPRNRVVHVGRTITGGEGLLQRLKNHLTNASSFSLKYLKGHGAKLRNGYSYRLLEISDPRLRSLVEHYAVGYLCPLHLGHGVPERRHK